MQIVCLGNLDGITVPAATTLHSYLATETTYLDDWFFEVTTDWKRKNLASFDDGIFVIAADHKFTQNARADSQQGVEILKHIRLTESLEKVRWWHAVVYSYLSLEEILRGKPENLILASRSVTLLRPSIENDLALDIAAANKGKEPPPTLEQLAAEGVRRETPMGLTSFIACDYKPARLSGHEIANWWGPRRVIEGLKLVEGTGSNVTLPAKAEKEMKHLETKKAIFLEGGVSSFGGDLNAQKGQWATAIETHRESLKRHFEGLNAKPKVVYVDDAMANGWDRAVHLALTGKPWPNTTPEWFVTHLVTPDNIPVKRNDWSKVAKEILDEKPALILMDLRLLGSGEAGVEVRKTSGGQIITKLRKDAPGVPILLLTASNKAWTYQKAFELGVDAFWMKEGMGDHKSSAASLQNTTQLVKLLDTLLGMEYQFLRAMHDKISEFAENLKSPDLTKWPWWKKTTWQIQPSAGDYTKLAADRLKHTEAHHNATLSLLKHLVLLFQEYLRISKILGMYQAEIDKREVDKLWLQAIAMRVGLVVESVHRFDLLRNLQHQGNQNGPQSRLARSGTIGGFEVGPERNRRLESMRSDWFGQALYEVRNIVAHFHPNTANIDWDKTRSLLAALFAWLSERPGMTQIGPRGTKPTAQDVLNHTQWTGSKELAKVYVTLYGSRTVDFPS